MNGLEILWQYWIIVAILCVVIEIMTVGFAFMCFAIGAVAAALVTFCGSSFDMQLLTFGVVTLLSFFFIRPMMLKITQRKDKEKAKSNADALIGRRGIVDEEITELGGRVVIDGDNWKAVSENGERIPKGAAVEITEINSIIITVKKI
jgi:membrane protein implicated in regulation of membrane protease activity